MGASINDPVIPVETNNRTNKKRNTIIVVSAIVGGVLALVCLCAVVLILVLKPFSVQKDGAQETPTASGPKAIRVAPMPDLIGTKEYSGPPPMLIDVNKKYFATVKMAKGGEFVIQLYPDKAPITVNSFVFLARQGFYDSVTFHRVLEGFMAQGGDPTGMGWGGPGYQFANEPNDLKFDKAGVVAMANAGRDTNGSQFFIMFGPYGLSGKDYTIFGQVIEGMDVVNGITRRDPQQNPDYPGDAMVSVTITEE